MPSLAAVPRRARFHDLSRELRQAIRALRKRPLFTATALLALALGIGADVAVFGVVDAVLVRPLAYADADRLVVVLHGGSRPVAPANFLDWKRDTRSFAAMGAAEMWGPSVTGDGRPDKLRALRVTGDVFPLLGARPLLGRALRAGDDGPGRDARRRDRPRAVAAALRRRPRRCSGARSCSTARRTRSSA